jgi:DNA-binding transcriptional LysR family regulator
MTILWEDFKVVLALARGGSVAAAARELQVDNSTVSRRLSALEESLGAQILIRNGREFTWTASGQVAVQSAKAMEVAISEMVRAVAAGKEDVSGVVRVATAPSIVPELVKHVLPELRTAHPGLTVEFGGSYHRVDLARGEADLALRFAKPQEPDFIARHATEVGWFVYASQSYLDLEGRPSSHDDLRRHRLVLYVKQMHAVSPLSWMEQYHAGNPNTARVDSLTLACNMVSTGGGIAVLPTFVGDRVPGLVRIFPERIGINSGWIVYHESMRDSARVRAVSDGLIRYFSRHENLFSGMESTPMSSVL